MKIFKAIYLLLFTVSGCVSLGGGPQKSIEQSLTYILRSSGEGIEDQYDAIKICKCVSRKVVTDWDSLKVELFDTLLVEYVNELTASHPKTTDEMLEFFKNGPPRYKPQLSDMLEDIVPLVQACEESTGVRRGIEF